MPSVLVIDDDPAIAYLVEQVLPGEVVLLTATSGEQGIAMAAEQRPDAVVLDVMLPDLAGLQVFERLHALDPKLPVIVVTAKGASNTAIEATRLGAYDFLVKPLDLAVLRPRIARALEIRSLTRLPVEIRNAPESFAGESDLLVGRSAAMQQVYKTIGRVARQPTPVLVTGETGTGKELVARAIHQYSGRSGPLVSVACASAADVEAILSRLGKRKARGTSPRGEKLDQLADGTLFLDEIGDLPLAAQSSLLELFQAEPEPSAEAAPAVRLIAATRHDLDELVAQGRFRADLYYHLCGSTMHLPPLRNRLEDLPSLARYFLMRFNQLLGKRVYRLAPECLEVLRQYAWPGNIRELQSILREALVRTTGSVLLADFLPPNLVASAPQPAAGQGALTDWNAFVSERLAASSTNLYAEAQAVVERQLISLVLRHTDGHQARAAALLGITRGSLRAKIRGLGIVIDRLVEVHPEANVSRATAL